MKKQNWTEKIISRENITPTNKATLARALLNKSIIFIGIFLLIIAAVTFAATVSHPATQITNGTFAGGIFVFPSDLNVTANVSAKEYLNFSGALEWINPINIFDVDKEDIETDLNVFVDIAGDDMVGNLTTTKDIEIDGYYYGDGSRLTNINSTGYNTNSSEYWDNLNDPSDINTADITDDNTYVTVAGDNMTGNLTVEGDITLEEDKALIIPTGPSQHIFSTKGTAFNGVTDYVSYWAYNLLEGTSNTHKNSSEPILKWGLESDYYDGSVHLMEVNLDYTSADGAVSRRPMAFSVNRATNVTRWGLEADYIGIEDQNSNLYASFNSTTGITLHGFTINRRTDVTGDSHIMSVQPTADNKTGILSVMPKGTPAGATNTAFTFYNNDFRENTSNYERIGLYAKDTEFAFGSEQAGTGILRNISFQSGLLYLDVSGGKVGIGTSDATQLLHSNKIGIGTTQPTELLEVYDSEEGIIKISAGAGNKNAILELNNSDQEWAILTRGAGADNLVFNDNTRGAVAMSILIDGKVGIGKETPSYPLDVAGDVMIDGGDLYVEGAGGWDGAGDIGKTTFGLSGVMGMFSLYGDGVGISTYVANAGGTLGTHGYDAFYCTNTYGDCGVGDITPSYKLDVNGNFSADDYYSGDGSQGITEDIVLNTTCTLSFKDGLLVSGCL